MLSTPALTLSYYSQNHDDSNNVNKTLPSVKLLAINTLLCFVTKDVTDGLGIKSMVRLKAFVEKVNGHNAFVQSLTFDELLIKLIFLHFYNELKFHILSIDGKVLGPDSSTLH